MSESGNVFTDKNQSDQCLNEFLELVKSSNMMTKTMIDNKPYFDPNEGAKYFTIFRLGWYLSAKYMGKPNA